MENVKRKTNIILAANKASSNVLYGRKYLALIKMIYGYWRKSLSGNLLMDCTSKNKFSQDIWYYDGEFYRFGRYLFCSERYQTALHYPAGIAHF